MATTLTRSNDLLIDDYLLQIFLALKRKRVTFYDRHRDALRDEPILDAVLADLWRELDGWDAVDLRFNVILHPMWGSSQTVEDGLAFLRQIGLLGFGHGNLAEYSVPDSVTAEHYVAHAPLHWNDGEWFFYFGPEFWDIQAQRILDLDRQKHAGVFW